jgi:tRNA threonylcarbamoyladenosine biosynthesis protein TsaE
MERWTTQNDQETISTGRQWARRLKPGDVVAVYGDLGSGKTRFIKGLCEGLGVREHVASPSFTIVNEYRFPGGRVFHFDFYRVGSEGEIQDIGFDEYLSDTDAISIIEWADRASMLLPGRRYDVRMSFGRSEQERLISIEMAVEVTQ